MSGYAFAIDRGGTFTDVYVRRPDGTSRALKLLSDDKAKYRDAPTEAIRRILEEETGIRIASNAPLPTDGICWIRMGTTVATNALLERKGERIALLITKGFKDLLFIGNQARPRIFDLDIKIPDLLYEKVFEVDERIILIDSRCELTFDKAYNDKTSSGDEVIVEKAVDRDEVMRLLKDIALSGIRSLAVALLHSFKYPKHERLIGDIAKDVGFTNISLSSAVMPMIKIVPRGFTACADAYLTPKIQDYITSFKSGFANSLKDISLQFMQSDGGLCPVERFFGSRAILSGPAAGVVGVALTAYRSGIRQAVISFDMGGTSTDVCRYAGKFEHVMETTTAGVTIQAPQLDIHTVAAGGGSRLFFRNGLFMVGPESSGADPGPICYRKNGFLSVTDANVVLGRIIPEYFPHIFGTSGKEPIDKDASIGEMTRLTNEANKFCHEHSDVQKKPMSVQETALGFIEVANEVMCRAIRSITQAKGYDTSKHILACFGGAGGQHACAVAKALGIKKVKINRFAGILSAYGLALADTVFEVQEPVGKIFDEESFAYLKDRLTSLKQKCRKSLEDSGFVKERIRYEPFLHMRYEKTDCALMCSPLSSSADSEIESCGKAFEIAYKREFGFILPSRRIVVDDIRVRGIGLSNGIEEMTHTEIAQNQPPQESFVNCVFKKDSTAKEMRTPVFDFRRLKYGHRISGPAIIIDANNTVVVEPCCEAVISAEGNIEIEIESQKRIELEKSIDPIQLSIFSHRFMSIAEQMGRILQRTAISTNIKERLDFSCALFGSDGGLVANAPHIPVHLGGMQATVKYQIESLGVDGMTEGDVILCNHPKAGGSHLPDLTVITPVCYKHSKEPVFFVANRGHHADIGGLVPGSMPPHSTSLEQEGASFVSFKIVEKGTFQEMKLVAALNAPGEVPGCSGTRNLADNISDLKAQIAANQKGINLVCELIDIYGLDVVQAYMSHIQRNAEVAVRKLLKEVAEREKLEKGSTKLHAMDFMDDGTPICLTIEINELTGDAVFDFDGTGPEVYSSCNAPRAVTMAAIIYCLRCLVGSDIPLNQGCLSPIKIKVPPGTILSPHERAAVVGGNVVTSQRICDVIFRAFKAVAASQGCMNNVLFGDEHMGGYYETVAGGAGAGPGFTGRSAVHTHMTNTRITDPEILESRYPVILREFGVRYGSGGLGRYHGGDGCIRKIQFRQPLKLSVLSERRAFAPYGLAGGEDGARGLNLLRRRDGRVVNLGGKNTVDVFAGDIFELRTPGGGGYGPAEKLTT